MEESPWESQLPNLVMKWSITLVKSNVIFHSNCSKEALDIAGLAHHAIFCPQFPTYRDKKSGWWKMTWMFPEQASLQYMPVRQFFVSTPSWFE